MGKGLKICLLTAAVVFLTGCGGEQPVISGSASMIPAVRLLCAAAGGGWEIQGGGSSAAVADVREGRSTIGLMSRDPLPEELGTDLVCAPVAYDPLVVVTAADSPISFLTKDSLRDLYLGKYSSWDQLGGASRPVVTVGREAGSGTKDTFESAVGCHGSCPTLTAMGSGMARLMIAGNKNAIGYISAWQADETLTMIPIDGCDLRRTLYFIWRKGDETAQSFYDFVRTPKGAQLLAQAGLLPAEESI